MKHLNSKTKQKEASPDFVLLGGCPAIWVWLTTTDRAYLCKACCFFLSCIASLARRSPKKIQTFTAMGLQRPPCHERAFLCKVIGTRLAGPMDAWALSIPQHSKLQVSAARGGQRVWTNLKFGTPHGPAVLRSEPSGARFDIVLWARAAVTISRGRV